MQFIEKLINLIVAGIFIVFLVACEHKETYSDEAQIVNRIVESEKVIKKIEGIINYKHHVLFFTLRNEIFGLNTQTALLTEYECNLDRLDEFLVINDSVFMVSGGNLYSISEITNEKIVFEEYDYKNGDSFSLAYHFDGFTITSCCNGEWGGSVYFQDNISKKIYSTASTCLMNVDTLNGDIYLFNNLPHLTNSTSIMKIGDIRSLPIVEKNEECNWYYQLYSEDYENIDSVNTLLLGNENKNSIVFDTFGFSVLHGFILNDEISLVHSSQNAISIFSMLNKYNVKLKSELVKIEGGQRILTRIGRSKDKVAISCSNPMGLTYIINFDVDGKLFEIFEIN